MIHSKISNILTVDKHTWKTTFDGLMFTARRILRIKCFAVAQAKLEPFSIYPVIFEFESNDIPLRPCEVVAYPKPDLKITGDNVRDLERYIVTGEISYTDLKIDYSYIHIQGYAHLMCPLSVSPKAFFIIEYEG